MYAFEFNAAEERWRLEARCRDGAATLTELFFSEDIGDIRVRSRSAAAARCAGSCLAARSPGGSRGASGAVSCS